MYDELREKAEEIESQNLQKQKGKKLGIPRKCPKCGKEGPFTLYKDQWYEGWTCERCKHTFGAVPR